MPKKIIPISQPYSDYIHDDDLGAASHLNLDHLSESFRIADALRAMGHEDAAECVRPVRLLAGFKPAALVQRLREFGEGCECACLACVNSQGFSEIIWSTDAGNAVNRLVNLKLGGGYVLGFIRFFGNEIFTIHPDEGPEHELHALMLGAFASAYVNRPLMNEVLALNIPANFEPQNVERTLDKYAELSDETPVNIHDEITPRTETVQPR